jgi:outer membrane protein assembly factor BamB
LTARPAATGTSVPSTVPTGGLVQFDAIGTFTKHKGKKTEFVDLTTAPLTFWTSRDSTILIPPNPGPNGGNYTTALAGCTCIQASNSGITSQSVPVGVYVDVATCTAVPCPGAAIRTGVPKAESTAAASADSAGVLMWSFDAGAELRGRIATGGDGSIYFITRDGILHGLDASGKTIMYRQAEGLAPVVLTNGTVIAMSSASQLAAIAPDGVVQWQLEIGAAQGPVAATDSAIYVSAGSDLLSVSSAGALNWRVNVGTVTSATTTPDGVVIASAGGAVTLLASDGAVVWKFSPDGGFSGSVAYADDVVYAGSLSGALYAIDARAGSTVWHVSTAGPVIAGPAVSVSGTIFFGSNAIYGVMSDGQLRWTQPAVKPGRGGMSALNFDDVFDAATGGLGVMLGSEGNYLWTSRSFGTITTTAVSPAGMLYVGNSNGRIFAIR